MAEPVQEFPASQPTFGCPPPSHERPCERGGDARPAPASTLADPDAHGLLAVPIAPSPPPRYRVL